MRIAVLGATGRVGREVVRIALERGFVVVDAVSSGDDVVKLFVDSNIIIDFSSPDATSAMLKVAKNENFSVPLLIGTTGLGDEHSDLMRACAKKIPVFYASNMSVAVAVLQKLVKFVAKLVDFDVEILEQHHSKKKDAPSGTAIALGKSVASARGQQFQDVAKFERIGSSEPRKAGEIGFAVQRGGATVGIHEVNFIGKLESLKLSHYAHDVGLFADGALKVALWLIVQKPGLYSMDDFSSSSLNIETLL